MDPTAAFAILESRETLPWRSRQAFVKYAAFSDERGTVFIKAGLLTMMRTRAERALPAETGGLLAGRVFRDERGPYSAVFSFAEAPRGAGRPGQFRVTPDGTYILKQRLAETEPACDVVGWFHSHPSPMQYSATDFANQRLWSDPQHVGVLIFARGGELGLVYQGPDAHLLPYVQARAAAPKPGARNGTVVRQLPTAPPPPLVAQLAPSKVSGPHRTIVGIGLAALVSVLVVLVLQVLAMHPTKTDRPPVPPAPSSLVVPSTGPTSEPMTSPAPGLTSSSMPSELPLGPWIDRPRKAYP